MGEAKDRENGDEMTSETRKESNQLIERAHEILQEDWASGMDIGLAGDALPSGNWERFCKGRKDHHTWSTLDYCRTFKPTILFDLSDWDWPSGVKKYDLTICSNVVEHTKDLERVFKNLGLMSTKWLIVDTPTSWEKTPWHGTKDFDDYHRLSSEELTKLVEKNGFKVILEYQGFYVAGLLAKKVD